MVKLFLKSKHHKIEQSASLIPQNDPTLLWINAGVAPLKNILMATEKPSNPTINKCCKNVFEPTI